MKQIIKAIIAKMPKDGKARVKLIVTIILGIVFILSWINTMGAIKKRFWGDGGQKVNPSVQVVRQSPKVQTNLLQAIENEDDGMEWIRCPFCGKLYIDGEGGVVALSGILWDDKTPKAVINGEIVGLGDNINKYSIVNINRSSVVLNDGVKDIEILLEE